MSTRTFGKISVMYAIDVEAETSGSGCVNIEMGICDSKMYDHDKHTITLGQDEAMALVHTLRCDHAGLHIESNAECIDVAVRYAEATFTTRDGEGYLDYYDTDLLAKNIERAVLEAVDARAAGHEGGEE